MTKKAPRIGKSSHAVSTSDPQLPRAVTLKRKRESCASPHRELASDQFCPPQNLSVQSCQRQVSYPINWEPVALPVHGQSLAPDSHCVIRDGDRMPQGEGGLFVLLRRRHLRQLPHARHQRRLMWPSDQKYLRLTGLIIKEAQRVVDLAFLLPPCGRPLR